MQSVRPTDRLPMRLEEEAEGLVSAVFRDVRQRMPFVPAIFKALAFDPPALLEAWLQARAIYDDPRAAAAAARLLGAARADLPYVPSEAVRRAAAPFVSELPSLLLVVTSLALTLEGRLVSRPPPPPDLPQAGPLPETPVAEERGEHPLFEEICAVYETAYVPSLYRALAAAGALEEAWRSIGPYLASPAGVAHVKALAAAAEEEAMQLPEVAFLSAASARPVLEQFRRALPRNLVFAVAARAP